MGQVRSHRTRYGLALAFLALALLVGGAGVASAASPEDEALAQAKAFRGAVGLPADNATVSSAM